MNKALSLPAELLNNLRCKQCSNYLSVFSVYVKTDGNEALCGRCKAPENDFLRDEPYESLAQFLIFPCSHAQNGCRGQLQPKELKNHESVCAYRKLECPVKNYVRCQWQGSASEVLKHFEETHKDFILRSRQFELSFLTSSKDIQLMPYNNEVFILKKELDSRSGTFCCTVEHLKQPECVDTYNYQLTVESGNKTSSYKFPLKSMDSDNLMTKVGVNVIMDKLQNPATVVGIIELSIKTEDVQVHKQQEQPVAQEYKDPSVEWDVLLDLECPVCMEYMLPPIYQCLQGHSICSGCKPQVTQCPMCRQEIRTTQNFILEKLTQRLKYPCKYYKSGCKSVTLSSEINAHEASCVYGPFDCPLKAQDNCTASCNKNDIVKHVDESHKDYILESDKINIIFKPDRPCEEYYLIKYASKIFKGCFKYADNKFCWAVQLVGTEEESKQFRFEIDIVDNSGKNLGRSLIGLCVPLSLQDQVFVKANTYEYVNYDQIAHLITKTFSYRIRLIKE